VKRRAAAAGCLGRVNGAMMHGPSHPHGRTLMPRATISISISAMALSVALVVSGAISGARAQAGMKPTAPQKMMSPREEQKMRECQQKAARQNVKMDERAKFVMDCMTAKAN